MARVLVIDTDHPGDDVIREAGETVREGGVVLSPTDTVYGLACDPFQAEAVARIVRMKGRHPQQGFLLLVAGLEWVGRLAREIPPQFESLKEFWPGPVTFLFEASSRAPEGVVSQEGKIGVRWPDSPFLEAWITNVGRPLLSTSANRTGEAIPDTDAGLRDLFDQQVDLLLLGSPSTVHASTVVDLTASPLRVVREGAWGSRLREALDAFGEAGMG